MSSASKKLSKPKIANDIIDNHLPVMITMVENENHDTEKLAAFYKDGLSQVRDFADFHDEIKEIVQIRLDDIKAYLAPLEEKICDKVNSSDNPLDLQEFLKDLKARDMSVVALKNDQDDFFKPPFKYNEVDLHFKLEMFNVLNMK